MIQYRVETIDSISEEFTNFSKAKEAFEVIKRIEIQRKVDYDSFVELVASTDYFSTNEVLLRVEAVQDFEKLESLGSPLKKGYPYDWWAKWSLVVDNI